MNLDSNIVATGIHIEENCKNFRISRHIFKWDKINICLVRAYCYHFIQTNIIIISQIEGEVIKSKRLIATIINKLQLKPQKTILITHIKNKFYQRLVRLNPLISIFNKNHHFPLDDEEEISLQKVEELIMEDLEPVETWFTLDADLYHEIELQRQGELKGLLKLYLKPDLDFFTLSFEQIEYKLEQIFEPVKDQIKQEKEFELPIRGALFYYPETKLEDQQKPILFIQKKFLKNSTDYNKLSALPYVNEYNVETEVVICVNIGDDRSVCGIFPKINFLRSKKTESDC